MKLQYNLTSPSMPTLNEARADGFMWDWETIVDCVQKAFRAVFVGLRQAFVSQPYWLAPAWTSVDDFVRTYPHLFHALCWSIFFGPIVLLIPLLFLHELGVILLHSLTFFLHGFVSSESYYSIRDSLVDSKEAMFATIEAWSASFNKVTTEKYPITFIRLVAGVYGLYVTIGIIWWPILSQNDIMPVWEILAQLWEVLYKQYFGLS